MTPLLSYLAEGGRAARLGDARPPAAGVTAWTDRPNSGTRGRGPAARARSGRAAGIPLRCHHCSAGARQARPRHRRRAPALEREHGLIDEGRPMRQFRHALYQVGLLDRLPPTRHAALASDDQAPASRDTLRSCSNARATRVAPRSTSRWPRDARRNVLSSAKPTASPGAVCSVSSGRTTSRSTSAHASSARCASRA
jgi:hypothetical protein